MSGETRILISTCLMLPVCMALFFVAALPAMLFGALWGVGAGFVAIILFGPWVLFPMMWFIEWADRWASKADDAS